MADHPSQHKAKKILKHGKVRDKALSESQKGFFGLIAGGGTPRKSRHAALAERMTS